MYSFLDPNLHVIAELARTRLEQKFNIKITQFEKGFDTNLEYAPTFFGKTNTHYIVCEVSTRPFPAQVKAIYVDILHQNIPVKYFVVYTNDFTISASELQKDIENAKLFGIGLINIDKTSQRINIQNEAVSVTLNLPSSSLQLNKFNKKFRPLIEESYSMYINGNPRHGVQELGQIIEQVIRNLAIESKRLAHYTNGLNPNLPNSAFASIIDDLIRNGIVNVAFLNRVRAFAEDRNSVSHRVNSIRKSQLLENKLKLDFQTGLRILEEIPGVFSNGKNGFKYKIKIV